MCGCTSEEESALLDREMNDFILTPVFTVKGWAVRLNVTGCTSSQTHTKKKPALSCYCFCHDGGCESKMAI